MARAIQFDGNSQRWAIEIQDILINWMLPPEFMTGEVSISEVTPENTFAVCRVLTEITGTPHGVLRNA